MRFKAYFLLYWVFIRATSVKVERALVWLLSMSWSGSGARALFPSEHKERKGIDRITAPEPSWLGTNSVCSCLPARESPQKLRGLGEFFMRGQGGKFPLQVWTASKVFCHALAWSAKPRSLAEHMELCLQSVVCYTSLNLSIIEKELNPLK